jgi:hypothetical protein
MQIQGIEIRQNCLASPDMRRILLKGRCERVPCANRQPRLAKKGCCPRCEVEGKTQGLVRRLWQKWLEKPVNAGVLLDCGAALEPARVDFLNHSPTP